MSFQFLSIVSRCLLLRCPFRPCPCFQFLSIVSDNMNSSDGWHYEIQAFNFCLLFPVFVVSLVVYMFVIVFSFVGSGFLFFLGADGDLG